MCPRKQKIKEAIAYYEQGINQDIFSEPVITYAKLAVEALKKELDQCSTN